MSEGTRAAIIIAAGVVLAVLLYIFFTPYHSCVRAMKADGMAGYYAAFNCRIQTG